MVKKLEIKKGKVCFCFLFQKGKSLAYFEVFDGTFHQA